MNKALKCFLWAGLLTCALLLFPGIYSRVSSEYTYNNVIIAADYSEFVRSASQAALTPDAVSEKIRDAGINNLIIKASLQEMNTFASLKEKGFKLIPYLTPGINESRYDINVINEFVQKFNIKYLFLDDTYTTSLPYYDTLSGVITKNHLITGVFEAAVGPGIEGQSSLEGIIKKTGYSVSRIYRVPDKDLKKLDTDQLYFRYLRSIVDRNIRLVYLRPLDSGVSGINTALSAATRLKEYIALHGYNTDSDIKKLTFGESPLVNNVAVPLGIVSGALLCVLYLFKPESKGFYSALIMAALIMGLPAFFLKPEAVSMTALLAALVFPSLAITVMIRLLRTFSGKPFPILLLICLSSFLFINALGVCFIAASYSDIRYVMGLSNFPGPGVVIAYIVPLLAAFTAYCLYFKNIKILVSDIKGFNSNHRIAGKAILIASTLFILYYVGRSGDVLEAGVPGLEIRIREALEQFLVVRPRFKEILVGYPAFILLVFFVKKYTNKLVILPLAIATAISGVSLTNSFCHSYTPVHISFLRGLYGLLTGLLVGFVLYIVLLIFQKIKPDSRIKNNNF